MSDPAPSTRELLARAKQHDTAAVDLLLQSCRERLKRMVLLRLDSRLRSRVDPSDVVQEALADAAKRLPAYLENPPVDFYPWLRDIASNRLIDLYRRHMLAERRSVRREQPLGASLPDESMLELAERLVSPAPSPSRALLRQEQRARVRAALDKLRPADREVLVLIYLEQLRPAEIAQIVGATAQAVNMRHLRALERLKSSLADLNTDD